MQKVFMIFLLVTLPFIIMVLYCTENPAQADDAVQMREVLRDLSRMAKAQERMAEAMERCAK